MTDEELHKRFDFLIEQQAQFASDIQKLQDGQAETNKVLNRLAAVTLEGFKDVNIKIDALVDSHLRISDSQLRLTESHAQLTDSHTQLTGSFAQLTDSFAQLTDSHTQLTNSFAQLTDSHRQLTDSHRQLTEAQNRTDESLTQLIAVVDRHFSQGRSGS